MKFADVTPGRSFTLGPVTVTQDEIIRFAGQYDDQWFHTDPELEGQGPFHGLIASGGHTVMGFDGIFAFCIQYCKTQFPLFPAAVDAQFFQVNTEFVQLRRA